MNRLIIFLVFLVFSCTEKNSNKILNLPLRARVQSLDPAKAYDTVSTQLISNVYQSLFQYHYLKRPYALEPLLANEWPIIKNNNTHLTFKIKPNIFYHPNPSIPHDRTVTAQDFIDQIKRIAFAGSQSPGWQFIEFKIKGIKEFRSKVGNDLNKMLSTPIEGIKLIDQLTFSIELNAPNVLFPNILAMSFFCPIPREAILYYQNELTQQDIGTGAYLIAEHNESNTTLLKFNRYFQEYYPKTGDRLAHQNQLLHDSGKQLPLISKINLSPQKNIHHSWTEFLNENLDILWLEKDLFKLALNNNQLDPKIAKKGIQLQHSPTLTLWWLAFNLKNPIFTKEVRLAIAHAINRELYIETFTHNADQIANSPFLPGIFGYQPSTTQPFRFDLDKAKKLMASAGYSESKKFPEIIFDTRNNSASALNAAKFIKDSLSQIGINVTVRSHQFEDFLKMSRAGELNFWQDGWTLDYPDPSNILELLVSDHHPPGSNTSYFTNHDIDKIFQSLQTTSDPKLRQELVAKAEKIFIDQLPWILLSFQRQSILLQQKIKNFRGSDIVLNNFKYLNIK